MKLFGKVAWIAGGARMGMTVARTLGAQGARVVLTWRKSRQPAEQAVRALRGFGIDAFSVRCDLSNPKEVRKAMSAAKKHFGRIDIVVNLASIYESAPVGKADQTRAWSDHMAANAYSAWVVSLEAARSMGREGGRIIHVADWTSASGRPRYKNFAAYYVSKKAVEGVVEAMALELAPAILVNGIAPGPMIPPPGLSQKEVQAVEDATPLRRWGGADEMAKAVQFLIETDFVTGETLRLDGGRHLY
jgi:NAD(P)-dependent dehydrogenase (short-subunit alcohol dehydrogenase family)